MLNPYDILRKKIEQAAAVKQAYQDSANILISSGLGMTAEQLLALDVKTRPTL